MRRFIWLLGAGCLAAPMSFAGGLFEEAVVFSGTFNGISGSNYRIPSVVAAKDGSLIAFSEGRASGYDPGSTAGQNRIVWRRSEDLGRTWSSQSVFTSPTVGDCSNPETVLDPATGALFVFYNKWPASHGQMGVPNGLGLDSCTVWYRKSTDNGRTWGAEVNVTSSVKDPNWAAAVVGPGNGIVTRYTHAGRIVLSGLRNTSTDRYSDPWTFYSDDHGATWQRNSLALAPYHADENNVVELTSGELMLNVRTNSNWRAKFVSGDCGASWAGPESFFDGITPVCAATVRYSAARDGGGLDRILFSAPAGTASGPSRNNLTVWISYDEGKTWDKKALIHAGMSAYSSMTILPDGTIGLLYETDGYGKIRFSRCDLQYLGDNAVPEPASLLGLGVGAGAVLARVRRSRRRT